MTATKRRKHGGYERYAFADSAWVQNLTQRDLAQLLGWKKQRLEALIRDKDRFVKREDKLIGSKLRKLAVPIGRLRSVHERLKFHLNKIKQPAYLFSPRKGRGQRDNALHHAEQMQFLSLDIKQFYPSTTDEHIFRWAYHVAGMRADVAGLFTKLVAIDGKMPFGSPVSPVLTTLVHREMFDEIFEVCQTNGLEMSVWVDDLTISGNSIPGALIEQIRSIIRKRGFKTHKIKYRSWGRPVLVTGVPIINHGVAAPTGVHRRVQAGYALLREASNDVERAQATDRLLGALGTLRYHVGSASVDGKKASNRMHALKQRRAKLQIKYTTVPDAVALSGNTAPTIDCAVPWD